MNPEKEYDELIHIWEHSPAKAAYDRRKAAFDPTQYDLTTEQKEMVLKLKYEWDWERLIKLVESSMIEQLVELGMCRISAGVMGKETLILTQEGHHFAEHLKAIE